jgi:WD40 repeat protein
MKTHFILFLITLCFHFSFGQTPKLVLPIGHTKQLNNATFSPNGKSIVTASDDNTAKIWDAQSGKLLHTLEGHIDEVNIAAFSSDSKSIVTGSDDNTAKIWSAQSGKLQYTLEGHTDKVNNATLSPDGKSIVTASLDNTAKIWDAQSGKLLLSLEGHSSAVWDATFSPGGKSIVTSSFDQTAKVWDAQSGKLLHSLEGQSSGARSPNFSPDSKSIVTISDDNTAKIWDVQSAKLLHSLEGHNDEVNSATFSPDGKKIVTVSLDKTAKIWDTKSGKLVHSLAGHTSYVIDATFSPDGKGVVTASPDETAKIWDTQSGKLLHNLRGHNGPVWKPAFSPDGKSIVTSSFDQTAKVWDAQSGKLLHSLGGHSSGVQNATFSLDGKSLVSASWDGTAKILDVQSGKLLHSLVGHRIVANNATFSPDGKSVVTTSLDRTAKVWDAQSGKLLHSLGGHSSAVWDATFSLDGKSLASASWDGTAKIWDTQSGKLLHSLEGHTSYVKNATFSPDGKSIVTASNDNTAKIWDTQSGKLLHSLEGHTNYVENATFSPDGKSIVTASSDEKAKIWDTQSGKLLRSLEGHTSYVNNATFSPDGKSIVTASDDNTAKIWDTQSGKLLHILEGHTDAVYNATFSPDGKSIVTSSYDKTAKIWDAENGKLKLDISMNSYFGDVDWTRKRIIATNNSLLSLFDIESGRELLSWVVVDKADWVVTHPSGLFDATPGAMDKLYFVQGMDVIDFNQLKERYYEPGLWKKVMAGEKLRSVAEMKSIALPPDIQVGQVDDKGYLNINLTNRGGGIGEVNLFVNGKEVIKDARDAKVKPDAPNASIKVFVGKHKSIVKGQENLIAVKAWNKDHWVQSRGQVVLYQSKEIENYKPAVHILTCGVSDYTGNEIDLKYAAKDANDVSTALQLGAKKLFGAERSYVYNLTTTQATEFYPTKTNILKAFEKISSTAHPLDIFVMYVSGHGINYGGQDGDWHYLTQEAYTGSGAAYNDPAIRAQTTISSNELVELFKKVPALKQVLMLDACASGKVVDNLIAQKDIESSTLRALDRMRDRTGMHIITGCTADAVSYEASKYGQGVLTYSLLEGIRGAALREDQYVDVNKLFQYAQDRVPQLAEGIGGIQSPQVFSPQGAQSFDIGILGEAEKKGIPIAKIKPVYIRSNFQDENEMEDVLGIGKIVNESLNEVSSKGIESQIIFVDVADYPEGCKLIGRYKRENGEIILKLRRKCGGEDKTFDLKAGSVEGLKIEILKVL